ncbi:C40 family peptidase [Kitasatospora sp. MAP5-34]|uniref:C40 family peptidase n=1 Tax=Kitasatospora sp. MAP5-34 TaxID=3035102 RepID=UPI0024754784|nr:C40 family peptidase [Kitasatospora sp. MAP5-34]MDH6576667.1 cell wall-associated NlpC family hydrolase [Kitasatospora sp. MAP5-34]
MARRLLPTLVLALTGVLGLLPAAVAAPPRAAPPAAPAALDGLAAPADDPYPSAEDIARAQAEADARATDTAAIEARLSAAQSELEQSGRVAEQAVEAYNGAQTRLAKARVEADASTRRAQAAEAARADAAGRAAELVAETYRQGASAELSAINALLGADGPRALTERAAAVSMAGARTKDILDAATATSAEASRASAAARTAAQDARRAAEAVLAAKERAQARLATQQSEVADIGRRRERLLAALATARNTTVELERKRREAQEAIAARAAEEAARAAAAAAQVSAATPGADGSSADGAGSARGVDAALDFARSKIGLPYIWGGEGPTGYDCSGLTMMAWRTAGRSLTHFAADQYAESTPVSYRSLRPGDLVFWTHTGRAADIYHVAIYLGDDQMIEAPRPGTAIKQASLWIMGRPDFYARPKPDRDA